MDKIHNDYEGEKSESFLFIGNSSEYVLSKSHSLQILTKFSEFSFEKKKLDILCRLKIPCHFPKITQTLGQRETNGKKIPFFKTLFLIVIVLGLCSGMIRMCSIA